jgi:hypothetical protein
MNPDLSNKALKQIEALCEAGCSQVYQLLDKAKKGESVEQLADFNGTEVELIIDELNQIMSVYETPNEDSQSEIK